MSSCRDSIGTPAPSVPSFDPSLISVRLPEQDATAATSYTIIDLGDLPGGADNSFASGINASGQVVGWSGAVTGTRAFLWDRGVMTDLGDLPGGSDSSVATGINASGQVGGSSPATPGTRAFLWDSGVMTDLGDLPGGNDHSSAYDINDSGQVVGNSGAATGSLAFLWDSGVMTDLGELPGGSDGSVAYGINNSAQVVGTSQGAAFVWDSGDGILDLNTLLDASGSGWTLIEATDINDTGWIVGAGTSPDGKTHGFLAIPEPATLSLLTVGDLALIRRRRRGPCAACRRELAFHPVG